MNNEIELSKATIKIERILLNLDLLPSDSIWQGLINEGLIMRMDLDYTYKKIAHVIEEKLDLKGLSVI